MLAALLLTARSARAQAPEAPPPAWWVSLDASRLLGCVRSASAADVAAELADALLRDPQHPQWTERLARVAELRSTTAGPTALGEATVRMPPGQLDALIAAAIDRAVARQGHGNTAEARRLIAVAAQLWGGSTVADRDALLDAVRVAARGGIPAPAASRTLADPDGRAAAEIDWLHTRALRRGASDAQALEHAVAYRAAWPRAREAAADAACIAEALRAQQPGWQRVCWLDGLAAHGWMTGGDDAVTEAIVGAIGADDPRTALDYAREFSAGAGDWWRVPGSRPSVVRSHYWVARAHEVAGRPDSARAALQQVVEAAPLSYYGQAAARRLEGHFGAPPWQRLIAAAALRDRIDAVQEADPTPALRPLVPLRTALAAPLEVCRAERPRRPTLAEITPLVERVLASGDGPRAAWLAAERTDLLWVDAAATADLTGPLLNAAFPVEHAESVATASLESGVPRSWLLAIGRKESRFNPHAVSPVGARGVMQLMPSTAQFYRTQIDASGSLYDAETNIRLAAAMLAGLSREHDGTLEVIAAAYCTGSSRVAGWRRRFGPSEGDVWLETVPFRVVRDYVREVVATAGIYSVLLDEDGALSTADAGPKLGG